jgi:hypothetical protein
MDFMVWCYDEVIDDERFVVGCWMLDVGPTAWTAKCLARDHLFSGQNKSSVI